jgi:hypothetical protein
MGYWKWASSPIAVEAQEASVQEMGKCQLPCISHLPCQTQQLGQVGALQDVYRWVSDSPEFQPLLS